MTPEREVWSGPAPRSSRAASTARSASSGGTPRCWSSSPIGPLRIQQEAGAELQAVVDGGFLHVSTEEGSTRADVLATQAELGAEIDVDGRARRLEELRSAAEGDDDDEVRSRSRGTKAQAHA